MEERYINSPFGILLVRKHIDLLIPFIIEVHKVLSLSTISQILTLSREWKSGWENCVRNSVKCQSSSLETRLILRIVDRLPMRKPLLKRKSLGPLIMVQVQEQDIMSKKCLGHWQNVLLPAKHKWEQQAVRKNKLFVEWWTLKVLISVAMTTTQAQDNGSKDHLTDSHCRLKRKRRRRRKVASADLSDLNTQYLSKRLLKVDENSSTRLNYLILKKCQHKSDLSLVL